MTINLIEPSNEQLKPRITVIGVGGAGCNAVNNMIEAMSNFVSLHYSLSSREDNQYWRDVTENIDYVNMGKHLYSEIDAMANTWMLMNSVENTFIKEHDEQSGSIYICAGQDYIPFGKASYKEKIGIHSNPYDVT